MACRVCCRGIALRLPPVSSRNRWSSRSLICWQRHRRQPGRRELERQRYAVQSAADRRDQRRGRRRRGRSRSRAPAPGPRRAGPRPTRRRRPRRSASGRRQRQRRHAVHVLAVDAERLPRGRQDAQPGAVADELAAELGGAVDHVLAVVEQDERVLLAQRVRSATRAAAAARLVCEPEDGSDRGRDLLGLGQRGELDEPHAVPGRASSSSAAAWSARRVFPQPPAPVRVTRREDPTSERTSVQLPAPGRRTR